MKVAAQRWFFVLLLAVGLGLAAHIFVPALHAGEHSDEFCAICTFLVSVVLTVFAATTLSRPVRRRFPSSHRIAVRQRSYFTPRTERGPPVTLQ